ncbi:unnamed protein product (mitochondrion) [Plasmodiophora brassicae]|uniref:Transglutaminase-like domain-containing protein n=1 Tax=Plasmodiophora brassicae TaxID=37360 RepID=A0A0G4J7U3_PLABS|nr:hypothetical protein PBRA_003116 [Plasmodiophora brassicae]SPQ95594.1 unnamed protein product [Plasmodiophora brassicae]
MSRRVRVEWGGRVFDIDDVGDDADVVRGQIYSLTDVEPEEQVLDPGLDRAFVDGFDGILHLSRKRSPEPADGSDAIDPALVLESIPWQTDCSKIWLGSTSVRQPGLRIGDTVICLACSAACKAAYVRHAAEVSSSGSDPFVCGCGTGCLFHPRIQSQAELLVEPFLGFLRTALGQLQERQEVAVMDNRKQRMAMQIRSYFQHIPDFENPANQAKALEVIPLQKLLDRGKERGPDALPGRDELVFQLLFWFKHEFFSWVNSLPCSSCGGGTTTIGGAEPNQEELRFGAGRVELHKCNACGQVNRFPRYNNSGKLMETRRGRCGEWAQAFTLCCRALKFDARYVVDWTDHVWTEVWSDETQRFVHCDPCENRYDAPLLYEAGWGKKLSYVIGFSVDGVRDVTRRYTANYATENGVLSRRRECPEDWLAGELERYSSACLSRMNPDRASLVRSRWSREKDQLLGISTVSTHDQLPGRESGSVEWRRARGELGDNASAKVAKSAGADSASSSSQQDTSKRVNPVVDGDAKARAQEQARRYFSQLTQGCGNGSCTNVEFCASAPGSQTNSKPVRDNLQRALQLVVTYGDSKLC